MDIVGIKNIAAMVTARLASGFGALTAGGAGNGTAVTGVVIQRSTMKNPLSAALCLFWSATLAATKTLSLGTVVVQDSADGVTFTSFATFADPGTVATGPTGGGAVTGQTTLSVNLTGARDYIRVLYTPALSNTSTDTATVAAALVFGGFDRLPAPV